MLYNEQFLLFKYACKLTTSKAKKYNTIYLLLLN